MADFFKDIWIEPRDPQDAKKLSDPKADTGAAVNKITENMNGIHVKDIDLSALFKRSREKQEAIRPRKPTDIAADTLKGLGLLASFQEKFPGKSFEIKPSTQTFLSDPPTFTSTITVLISGGSKLNVIRDTVSWTGKKTEPVYTPLSTATGQTNEAPEKTLGIPTPLLRQSLERMLQKYERNGFDETRLEDTLNPV